MKRLLLLFLICFTPALTLAATEQALTKSFSTGSVVNSLVMLFGIILAIIVVVVLLKKTQQINLKKNSGLKVIGGITIGGKERLVVVQMNDKQLLLGVTSHSINCLDTCDKSSSVEFVEHYKANIEKLHA